MRILDIIQCADLGGMEHTTLLRLTELIRCGHKCRLVSLNKVGGLRPLLEGAGVPYSGLTYRSPWGIPTMPTMSMAFRREDVDAIMMTGPNLAAMMALGNLCRDRRILTIHFHHQGVKRKVSWKLIYRVAMNVFPVITFPTAFIKAEAEDIFPPLKTVSRLLPNPLCRSMQGD
jgi:glycosyl transferase family 4